MSRYIDPENLSNEDLLYIAHRPKLRQEFILQGHDDPLADFDFSVLNPNEEETYGVIAEDPSPEGESTDPGTEADWRESMTKAELLAVINARNVEYADDGADLIEIEGVEDLTSLDVEDVKKDVLVAALKADDEELNAND